MQVERHVQNAILDTTGLISLMNVHWVAALSAAMEQSALIPQIALSVADSSDIRNLFQTPHGFSAFPTETSMSTALDFLSNITILSTIT